MFAQHAAGGYNEMTQSLFFPRR